jgi:hypothetical protein
MWTFSSIKSLKNFTAFPITCFLLQILADWTCKVSLYLKVRAEHFAQLEKIKSLRMWCFQHLPRYTVVLMTL